MRSEPKPLLSPSLSSAPSSGEGARRAASKSLRCLGSAGFGLIECIAYLALVGLILGMTFMAFYRASENTGNLHRDAADIARALRAGERWRDDVRTAGGPPRLEQDAGEQWLLLPHADGDVRYALRDRVVWRQAMPNTNWMAVLPATAASAMRMETRQHVATWHWDVELQSRPRLNGARPVFSFVAVRKEAKRP